MGKRNRRSEAAPTSHLKVRNPARESCTPQAHADSARAPTEHGHTPGDNFPSAPLGAGTSPHTLCRLGASASSRPAPTAPPPCHQRPLLWAAVLTGLLEDTDQKPSPPAQSAGDPERPCLFRSEKQCACAEVFGSRAPNQCAVFERTPFPRNSCARLASK